MLARYPPTGGPATAASLSCEPPSSWSWDLGLQRRPRGVGQVELQLLRAQERMLAPLQGHPDPVGRHREQVVPPGHDLGREPSELDAERVGRGIGAAEVDDPPEVAVLVA